MNSASTSPSSQSPGEPVQRDVEATSVRQSFRGPPTSPRNAILSQTSLQHPIPEPTSASTADGRSHDARALEKRRDVHKKISSEHRKRSTRAQSDLSLVNLSRLELDRLRNDPKAESFKMRDLLETAVRQVHVESKRAEELQRINDETATKFRVLNENRLSAQQEAAKAKTELKLYQFQLDSAQKEIEKAKSALKEIEKQRDEAEEAAARAREKARKYQQERLIANAREDGRKLGYEAGLKHAKREKEILAPGKPRSVPQPPSRSSKGKERAHYPEDDDRHSRSRPARNDNGSSPEYSPSQTPKRNLRPSNQTVRPSQRMRAGSAAPQRFRPPDREEEEDEDEDDDDYESESEEHPPSRPARATTPSIQVWPVNIPAADKLNESFNSNEHPNDVINQGPRERWVTAHRHHEIRGPSNPPIQPNTKSPIVLPHTPQQGPASNIQFFSPGSASGPAPFGVPPPGSIMIVPPPGVTPPRQPPLIKSVKFWARRPTLAKTKQQASSWYRSFSLRKKNKPVIDPIPEESTASPHSGAPVNSNFPEIQAASDSPDVKLYGPRPQQTQSWYRSGGAPSLRNHDISYARRQQSDGASVSTRVSQFDLLSTPALQSVTSISLPRTKNKGQVKEKDSFLSVIKEDSSRGNTPERPHGVGGPWAGTQAMPQPNFPPGFHQSGRASSSGSVPNRHSRRPPTIYAPDHDTAVQSAGGGYQGYSSNPNLHRKPSIDIDVVPPSGRTPHDGTSPPHTGQNHLSPYHVFRPEESIRSLRDAIDSFARQPARPDSVASNRRPGYSRTGSGAGPSGQHGSPLQNPQPAFMTRGHGSSGSPHASGSNRQLRNTASTATFKVVNPDPPQPDNRSTRARASSHAQPMLGDIINGEDEGVILTPRREPSRASMKSTKSYSRYNPDEYVDPAFWGVNGPGDPPAALPAQPRPGMEVDATDMERAASRLSRRISVDSGLSYA